MHVRRTRWTWCFPLIVGSNWWMLLPLMLTIPPMVSFLALEYHLHTTRGLPWWSLQKGNGTDIGNGKGNGPQQQLVPFVLEVQDRLGHCARQLFKRLFAKIPIVPNRVSRDFWAWITLAHARCVASNIVHRSHTMKRHGFCPFAPQHFYFFEPYFGQNIDPTVDTLPK